MLRAFIYLLCVLVFKAALKLRWVTNKLKSVVEQVHRKLMISIKIKRVVCHSSLQFDVSNRDGDMETKSSFNQIIKLI